MKFSKIKKASSTESRCENKAPPPAKDILAAEKGKLSFLKDVAPDELTKTSYNHVKTTF